MFKALKDVSIQLPGLQPSPCRLEHLAKTKINLRKDIQKRYKSLKINVEDVVGIKSIFVYGQRWSLTFKSILHDWFPSEVAV